MTVMRSMTAAPAFPGRSDMEWIEGGSFLMGSDHHRPEERPKRRVQVNGFWIDRRPVSNEEFTRFVRATGYCTVAENASMNRVSSGAFALGADWSHPLGPESSIEDMGHRPVVHLALADVEAYVAWAGASLPTEKEWEYAASGGREDAEDLGRRFTPHDATRVSAWRRPFRDISEPKDGWAGPSSIGNYPPDGWSVDDMIGNVWEWTEDWWFTYPIEIPAKVCCSAQRAASADLTDPLRVPRRVLKGGADLSASEGDPRYRPSARLAHQIDSPSLHIGFRCVIRPGWRSPQPQTVSSNASAPRSFPRRLKATP